MLWKETATPDMIKIIKELKNEPLMNDFILAGGTALALQIGHRISEDIDLFTTKKQNFDIILKFLENKYDNIEIKEKEEYFLRIFINDIKVDIVGVKGNLIENTVKEEGMELFSINDLSAMKLLAIESRKEIKDYIDIVYLLNYMTLDKMFENYKKKYNKGDIIRVKKELLGLEKINPFQLLNIKMLKNDVDLLNIHGILKSVILEYNSKIGIGNKGNVKKQNL